MQRWNARRTLLLTKIKKISVEVLKFDLLRLAVVHVREFKKRLRSSQVVPLFHTKTKIIFYRS